MSFGFELAFKANAFIKETFSAILLHFCPYSCEGASRDCPGLDFGWLVCVDLRDASLG
jgi:hypothetical protein